MFNESFNVNNIIYANNNSKVTLKTKQKLDELAAQENKKSSNKENLIAPPKPRVSNIKKNFILPAPASPVKSEFINRKSSADFKISVKEKKKFFESLTKTNSQENKSKFNLTKPSKDFTEILKRFNKDDIAQEIILPPPAFTAEKLDEDIFENILNEEHILPPLPYIADEVDYNLMRGLMSEERSFQALTIKPIVISELEESFDKTDKRMNELSLEYGQSRNGLEEVIWEPLQNKDILSHPQYLSNESVLNECSIKNTYNSIHEASENRNSASSLYPSLTCDFNGSSGLEKVILEPLQNKDILSHPQYLSNESVLNESKLEASCNRNSVSSLYPSLSSFSVTAQCDFSESRLECEQISNEKVAKSLSKSTKIKRKKVRRSISFIEKISVIEIGSDLDSLKFDIYERTDEERLRLQLEDVKQKSLDLAREICPLSNNNKPGNFYHVSKCVEILENNNLYTSLVERQHLGKNSKDFLSHVDLCNVQISVKDEYVFYNLDSLIKLGYGEHLNNLSSLFHVILVARSVGGSDIMESSVFSIVKRQEAKQIKLHPGGSRWLEMFHTMNFIELPIQFKLNFELYCMHVTPKKYCINVVDRFKSLYRNSPQNIESTILFTNIGSFNLTSDDIHKKKFIEKRMNLPQSSPLDGNVKLISILRFGGFLNIYREVNGRASWSLKYCEIISDGIVCGKKPENGIMKEIDIVIPFSLMKGPANLCDFLKPNSLAVYLEVRESDEEKFINQKITTSGEPEYIFMGASDSEEDVSKWCNVINQYIYINF